MVIPAAVSPIDSAAASPRRREDSTPASAQTAELALKAFMSMNRAVAIIDADGRLLQPNLVFERLFGGSDLLDRINGEAIANDGKSDREITLNDGRAFWVETIPMDGGWLVSAYEMAERSAKAGTDTLTKLGNRLMFQTQLAALLASPDRAAAGTAVLELDLGRFKAIRESLGREVSGELLVSVAERIRSALAGGDVVARLGGDNFGIIQAGQAQPQAAAALAERLIDLIGRSHLIEGHLIDIEASVGIVLLPTDAADCEQLLKNADLALHRAKCDGPGSFRFFEPAMDAQMQRRRQFESDLRRAMALSEFSLVYQPQINLQRATVTGFEALLRWQSPTRGAVPPVEFIPIAEDIGIIGTIGEWVVRTACREAATWPSQYTVSVNVSAIQFRTPNLVAAIVSALAESGLEPRRLELEITESVMLDAGGAASAMLTTLRELGVRVALDDFGVGYSSMGYLRSFPFDRIKIDQSFVRCSSEDLVGRAIVRAVVGIGQSLGMATVAEGIETEEQLARIVAEGCTEAQGFLFGRPMPPDQIEHYLSSCKHGAVRQS